jgi:Predicted membrane protein (DUF2232)
MSRLQTVSGAVLCGAGGAGLYLSVLTGSPAAAILVSLAQLPLFIAGLWLGTAAAALAGLTAAAIVLAAARDLMAAALFVALYVVPVVFLVRQALLARTLSDGALEWYPPGRLTAWLTGLAAGLFGIALLWFGGPQAMQSTLRQALAPALAELIDTTLAQRRMLTQSLAAIVPGILAASWMMLVITNGVLAQGVLARFGANWRPSPQIAALRLPPWLTVLLGAAAVATMLGGPARFLGINVTIVLSIPFCLAGLGVVHAFAGRLVRPAMPLATFYVLAGLFGWPLLLVALLGLLDMPLGLRRRLGPPQSFGGELNG